MLCPDAQQAIATWCGALRRLFGPPCRNKTVRDTFRRPRLPVVAARQRGNPATALRVLWRGMMGPGVRRFGKRKPAPTLLKE